MSKPLFLQVKCHSKEKSFFHGVIVNERQNYLSDVKTIFELNNLPDFGVQNSFESSLHSSVTRGVLRNFREGHVQRTCFT